MTLTVSTVGDGGGWVTSDPAGISCSTTCSAQFPAGTSVLLLATPAAGSTLFGWAVTPTPPQCYFGFHPAPRDCQLLLDTSADAVAVQATFNRNPPRCIVPNVKGMALAEADAQIHAHHCGVGRVTHVFSLKRQRGRVISQAPAFGWIREQGAKVKLRVGGAKR